MTPVLFVKGSKNLVHVWRGYYLVLLSACLDPKRVLYACGLSLACPSLTGVGGVISQIKYGVLPRLYAEPHISDIAA